MAQVGGGGGGGLTDGESGIPRSTCRGYYTGANTPKETRARMRFSAIGVVFVTHNISGYWYAAVNYVICWGPVSGTWHHSRKISQCCMTDTILWIEGYLLSCTLLSLTPPPPLLSLGLPSSSSFSFDIKQVWLGGGHPYSMENETQPDPLNLLSQRISLHNGSID